MSRHFNFEFKNTNPNCFLENVNNFKYINIYNFNPKLSKKIRYHLKYSVVFYRENGSE